MKHTVRLTVGCEALLAVLLLFLTGLYSCKKSDHKMAPTPSEQAKISGTWHVYNAAIYIGDSENTEQPSPPSSCYTATKFTFIGEGFSDHGKYTADSQCDFAETNGKWSIRNDSLFLVNSASVSMLEGKLTVVDETHFTLGARKMRGALFFFEKL